MYLSQDPATPDREITRRPGPRVIPEPESDDRRTIKLLTQQRQGKYRDFEQGPSRTRTENYLTSMGDKASFTEMPLAKGDPVTSMKTAQQRAAPSATSTPEYLPPEKPLFATDSIDAARNRIGSKDEPFLKLDDPEQESEPIPITANIMDNLIRVESDGNPDVIGDDGQSIGLGQIKIETAKNPGFGVAPLQGTDEEIKSQLLNPDINRQFAQDYLTGIYNTYASVIRSQSEDLPPEQKLHFAEYSPSDMWILMLSLQGYNSQPSAILSVLESFRGKNNIRLEDITNSIRAQLGASVYEKTYKYANNITNPVDMQAGGQVPQINQSGFIQGPGSPVSDSIPMKAEPGSFIVNAPATQMIGQNKLNAMTNNTSTAKNTKSSVDPQGINVSNGEFKVSKSDAERIGYDNLNRINDAGKPFVDQLDRKGYAEGGQIENYFTDFVIPAEFNTEEYHNAKKYDLANNDYIAYKDNRGFITFGPGVKADKNTKVGDRKGKEKIDKEAYRRWKSAVESSKRILNSDNHRAILPIAEMVYQMGATNIRKFRKLLGAVAIGDAREAYRQAMASDWARQTPERAEKVAARLKEAIIPIPIPKPGQADQNKVFVSESVPLKPAPPKPTSKPFVDNTNYQNGGITSEFTKQEQDLLRYHQDNLYGNKYLKNDDGSLTTLYGKIMSDKAGTAYLIPGYNSETREKMTDEEAWNYANTKGLENFPSYSSVSEARQAENRLKKIINQDMKEFLNPVNLLDIPMEQQQKDSFMSGPTHTVEDFYPAETVQTDEESFQDTLERIEPMN